MSWSWKILRSWSWDLESWSWSWQKGLYLHHCVPVVLFAVGHSDWVGNGNVCSVTVLHKVKYLWGDCTMNRWQNGFHVVTAFWLLILTFWLCACRSCKRSRNVTVYKRRGDTLHLFPLFTLWHFPTPRTLLFTCSVHRLFCGRVNRLQIGDCSNSAAEQIRAIWDEDSGWAQGTMY